MNDFVFIILFIYSGSLIGKFLNNFLYENAIDKNIGDNIYIRFFSLCPHCKVRTRYFFIPFLDYILNKRKCLKCDHTFPLISLFLEILTSIYYPFCYFYFVTFKKQPLKLLPAIFFGTILILISFIDIKHRIIPNKIIVPSIIIGLALQILFFPDKTMQWVIFSVCAGLFFLIISLIYPEGMGMGDVKLATFLGILLGKKVVVAIAIGFIIGGLFSIFLLIFKIKKIKDEIPFAPFLAIGAILAYFF
ncbi:MAG: A24 family peptidase [Actinobacteria bacterium]|nr:A24 family peptidase [Actinomycetota bacterium]